MVEGMELCPACDGLSPVLGFRRDAAGELEECIVNCGVCHNQHVVTVSERLIAGGARCGKNAAESAMSDPLDA